ncbi:hypothetical protein FGG08_004266 [Glutinoglossum americanum]|uniref:Ankyrin repeat protein n=1 Tax=Glutinoglossum americanum TaxID=1670608 RepID=A0A9P8I9J9_9PEZI|nr:hypothetical protein FGG08_004266 [Glutinoglossum americanum]
MTLRGQLAEPNDDDSLDSSAAKRPRLSGAEVPETSISISKKSRPSGSKTPEKPQTEQARLSSKAQNYFNQAGELGVTLGLFKEVLSPMRTSEARSSLAILDGVLRERYISILKKLTTLGDRASTNGYDDLAGYTYIRTLKASDRLGNPDKEFTVSLYSKMALFYKKLGDHNETLECLIKLSKLEPKNLIADLACSYQTFSKTLPSHLPTLSEWVSLSRLDMKTPVPFLHWAITSLCTSPGPTNGAATPDTPGGAGDVASWIGHYIRSTPQYHERDIFSRTPLFVAAQYGAPKVTAALLSTGADANDRDADGRSTMEVAAGGGHNLVVKQLLEAKADPDIKGSMYGSTPIQAAAESGHIDTVRILLGHVKEVRSICDIRSRDGKTARDLALKNGHREIARLLDEKAMDLNSRYFMESVDEELQMGYISMSDFGRLHTAG